MLYLILSVIASSATAIIMRLGEGRIKNNYAMFAANYFVCSLTAFLFIEDKNIFVMREGLPFTIVLGLISGCLYLSCFTLMKLNITKNGVMLSSVFMKLGVLVPAVMAVAVFGEKPGPTQIVGFAVALAAIILIYAGPKEKGSKGAAVLLLVLLVVSGFTESMANIYDKAGTASLKDNFLFFNFFTAMCLALIVTAILHKPVSRWDVIFGVMIGVPNYFASRCLIMALGTIPAVVVYPIYNVGAIVLIGLAGLFLFKERLNARKYVGFGLIAAALVLLNL